MKKTVSVIFIIISLIMNFTLCAFSIPKNISNELSKIENELFGYDSSNKKIEDRIQNLERTIYGKSSQGNINSRFNKIVKDINSEQIGLEIPPTEDTFAEKEELIADNTVNYPIVDEIEMKIFNKTYKNRDFHTRIVTIERKLFGKIYDVEDYSTRMDRIKAEVMPEKLAREKVFGYDNSLDNSLSSTDLSSLNSNRYTMPYGQENYTRPYANYGDITGAAASLPHNLDNELAQLEFNTFGTEFSNDDTETRIKRLNSVNKAKKSSQKYDSQKFQQRMSTVMEIGAMLLMILAMVL